MTKEEIIALCKVAGIPYKCQYRRLGASVIAHIDIDGWSTMADIDVEGREEESWNMVWERRAKHIGAWENIKTMRAKQPWGNWGNTNNIIDTIYKLGE